MRTDLLWSRTRAWKQRYNSIPDRHDIVQQLALVQFGLLSMLSNPSKGRATIQHWRVNRNWVQKLFLLIPTELPFKYQMIFQHSINFPVVFLAMAKLCMDGQKDSKFRWGKGMGERSSSKLVFNIRKKAQG